jgi:hypothetical protein
MYGNLKNFNVKSSTSNISGVKESIEFEGSIDDEFQTTFKVINPTADRLILAPDANITINKVEDLSGSVLPGVIQSNISRLGIQSANLDMNGYNLINSGYLYTEIINKNPGADSLFIESSEFQPNLIKTSNLYVENIFEERANVGTEINGILLKNNIISTDTINEKTSAAGVTIEGVLIKDNIISTDTINEKTGAAGVTIEGVLIKDNIISTDTINEKTSATGVTIEGVLIKDNKISALQSNEQSPGVICSDISNDGNPSTRKVGLAAGTGNGPTDNFCSGLMIQSNDSIWVPVIDGNTSGTFNCSLVNLKCKTTSEGANTGITTAATFTSSTFSIFPNLTTKAISKNIVTITGTYSVTATDHVILTNGHNVDLPSPANLTVGRELTIKNINSGSSSAQITPSGGTLEGDVLYILEPGNSITIITDSNKDWFII